MDDGTAANDIDERSDVEYRNGPGRIYAWGAGIAAVLITGSIFAVASALWSINDRMARLEVKVEIIQSQLAPRYRGGSESSASVNH